MNENVVSYEESEKKEEEDYVNEIVSAKNSLRENNRNNIINSFSFGKEKVKSPIESNRQVKALKSPGFPNVKSHNEIDKYTNIQEKIIKIKTLLNEEKQKRKEYESEIVKIKDFDRELMKERISLKEEINYLEKAIENSEQIREKQSILLEKLNKKKRKSDKKPKKSVRVKSNN